MNISMWETVVKGKNQQYFDPIEKMIFAHDTSRIACSYLNFSLFLCKYFLVKNYKIHTTHKIYYLVLDFKSINMKIRFNEIRMWILTMFNVIIILIVYKIIINSICGKAIAVSTDEYKSRNL